MSVVQVTAEGKVRFAGYDAVQARREERKHVWTPELVEQLKVLWAAGPSASEIAAQLGNGFSRNAILGKVFRLGLPTRGPVRPPRPRALNRTTKRQRSKSPFKVPKRVAAVNRRLMWAGRPLLPFIAEPAPPPKSETWRALPGSSPISIEAHTDGCRWPIGDDRPYRYCNLPVESGSYCGAHARVSARRAYTISPHFTDPPLDDDNSLAAQAEPERTV